MELYSHTQILPGEMKLLTNYIVDSGKTRNFRTTSRKYHTDVDFIYTQDKDKNVKNKTNRNGDYHSLHFRKQDNWDSE